MQKISDVMTEGCITVSPESTCFEAAELMKEHDIGFLPVVKGQKLAGVVTDRDLVIRGLAHRLPGTTPVREVCSDDVLTVSPGLSIDEAVSLMAAHQIRRLPVVEDGDLKGVVALGDLAVREVLVSEAGDALSGISEHEHRESGIVH